MWCIRTYRVVGADSDANHERAEDIEEQDTPEYATNSLGDVLPGICSLACGHSYHLHATIRKCSIDQGTPQAGKSSGVSGTDVLLHGSFFPIPETTPILIWSPAEHNHQSADEQSEDGDYLDAGEDKLCFTVDGDGKDVQAYQKDDDECDPNGGIDLVVLVPI